MQNKINKNHVINNNNCLSSYASIFDFLQLTSHCPQKSILESLWNSKHFYCNKNALFVHQLTKSKKIKLMITNALWNMETNPL